MKQKPVPYTHQDIKIRHFLEDVSLPWAKKKGDARTAAFYGGKRTRTVLPALFFGQPTLQPGKYAIKMLGV